MKKVIASILVLSSIFASTGVLATENTTKAETKVENNANLSNSQDPIDKYLKDGKFNVLIMGIDGPEDEGQKSVSIMLAQFNKKAEEIRIVSLPWDSIVDVPGYGEQKAIYAFYYGGAKLSQETFAKNFDVALNGYTSLNFTSFPKFVDTLGGVELDLTKEEAKEVLDKDKEGKYTLNGEQALEYGKLRKIDSDYKRTERQRKLIKAFLTKVKTISPKQLPELAKNTKDVIATNIDLNAVLELGKYALERNFKFVEKNVPEKEEAWGNSIDGGEEGLKMDMDEAKKEIKKFFE